MSANYKQIKAFHSKHGEVHLLTDGTKFVTRICTFLGRGATRIHDYSGDSLDAATELYEMACVHIRGYRPQPAPDTKCAYNPQNIKACSASNCPREVGGRAFWEFFGGTCKHRQK